MYNYVCYVCMHAYICIALSLNICYIILIYKQYTVPVYVYAHMHVTISVEPTYVSVCYIRSFTQIYVKH